MQSNKLLNCYITVPDRELHMQIDKELQNIGKEQKLEIVFCVFPNDSTYGKIKKLSELKYDVLTQCIKGITLKNKVDDPSTISNIILKDNVKLNGTNHKIQNPIFDKNKCMFIGADVSHPSDTPSR